MPVVYMIINTLNGKKYIGADSCDNPNYFGSGLKIKLAIKKYGKENFVKEVLENCESDKLMYEREKYWIEFYNAVDNDDYYNLCEGGNGGSGTLKKSESKEKHKLKCIEILKTIAQQRKGKTYIEIYGKKRAIEECKKRKEALMCHEVLVETRIKLSKSHMGKMAWNKGLTKENDIRVKKYSNTLKNVRKNKPLKEYHLLTPNKEKIIFNGKKELQRYFNNINKSLPLKSRINVDLLIATGERFDYFITHSLIGDL